MSADHRQLPVSTHSSPTRRSTDLIDGDRAGRVRHQGAVPGRGRNREVEAGERARHVEVAVGGRGQGDGEGHRLLRAARVRSEEHTSELQSLMRISYAVFCLKKKMTI